jgi:hypothetical protein
MLKYALLFTSMISASACGGSTVNTASENAETAGGEESVMSPALRTTTPIPVPQPAVAREGLSEPLQRLWTAVEEAVAIRPPDPPAEDSLDAVQGWSQGPFSEWVRARIEANERMGAIFDEVPEVPVHERGIAAALVAYALEDFAGGVGGAPVPTEIARDAELLEIYRSELTDAVHPLASSAVLRYAFCQQRLAPLGDESEWLPWRAYCVQRGQEMISIYGLRTYEEVEPEAVEGEI